MCSVSYAFEVFPVLRPCSSVVDRSHALPLATACESSFIISFPFFLEDLKAGHDIGNLHPQTYLTQLLSSYKTDS